METAIWKTIHECRACESPKPEVFFTLGDQPPANSLRKELHEKLPQVPLTLGYCHACSLIQLMDTVDPKYLFSTYVWVTGTSSTASEYSKEFFQKAVARYGKGLSPNARILEIASNDGTFLKVFRDHGFSVLGVDPAINIAAKANAAGIPTEAVFFGTEIARRISAQRGTSDIVFARNVLPHVSTLHDVVQGIGESLSQDGLAIIEFHSAQKILEELHYDSIYHEHLCYFSLKPLEKLFERYGMFGVDLDVSPISGGSHVLYLSKNRRPPSEALERARVHENSLMNTWAACREFAGKSERHRNLLVNLVRETKDQGKRIIGYGASARSSTLLNFCRLSQSDLECIADQSPYKHNLFTPGTDIPILAPEQAMAIKPDAILLLAWNFEREILEILRSRFGFTGEVILPLPLDPQKLFLKG